MRCMAGAGAGRGTREGGCLTLVRSPMSVLGVRATGIGGGEGVLAPVERGGGEPETGVDVASHSWVNSCTSLSVNFPERAAGDLASISPRVFSETSVLALPVAFSQRRLPRPAELARSPRPSSARRAAVAS